MIITNWFVRAIFLIVFLIVAVIGSFFPVLIAKCLFSGFWINPTFDDLAPPSVREKRRLLREKPEEYAERYPDDVAPIRIGGLVAWLCFFVALYGLLQDLHVFSQS